MAKSLQLRKTSRGLVTSQTEHFSEAKLTRAVALRNRNRRARELRAQGYVAICKTWDFTDLGWDRTFTVEYWKDV